MSGARSSRVRAAPALFSDEQAAAVELARLSWQERNPVAFQVEESSSSNESDSDAGPEDDEERKESDHRPAAFPWRAEQQPVEQRAFAPPRLRRAPPPAADTPLDFFHLFMPHNFLQSMADLTNAYAQQKHAARKENAAPAAATNGSQNTWTDTSVQEIEAMFGCLIYMGIVCMNATRDYWAEMTRQPFVADCFPRNRFMELLRCLRVSDEEPGEDNRLTKLQQLINTLENTLLRYFYPGQHVCVDEAMVAFQGRSRMVQFIAKKASPTGFKVWMLVDSDTNYVVAFDVFTGRKGREKEAGAAGKVVLALLDRLQPHCNHVVAMDGYFSSAQLCEQLLERGFYAVGTTRHNRKHFPKELLDEIEHKQRGESVWRQKKDSPLVVISWKDKKPVNFISTCTDPEKMTTVKRWIDGEEKEVPCPDVVPLYIKRMRGVDVFAQRQSYNKIGRRSRKWFYSLLWYLVDIAIHNAFILYQQKHHKQHYDEKAFRKELMQLLVANFCGRTKSFSAPKRPRDALHQIVRYDVAHACRECSGPAQHGKNNRRSHFSCADCNVALCMPNCYNRHIQKLAAEQAQLIDES